jgi:predicted MFS family arabinose efflux permease
LSQIRATFGVTIAAAGLLVTVFTAGYTLASPIIGGLTDRLGRRAVLYTGILLFIVFEAVSAWAPNFAVLLAARAISGLAAAAISPLLTTQATRGGSNSTIMCQDIAMTLGWPLRLVVSRTTGPGSSNR